MTGESVKADPNMEVCPEILATVTSQLLWSSATMHCGSCRLQISLCDYSNVVSFGHNELWLIKSQIAFL